MSKSDGPPPRSTAEVALAAARAGWGTTVRFLLVRLADRPVPGLIAVAISAAITVWLRANG